MPVKSTHQDTVMVIRYQTGTSGGTPILRQKSIMGLKESATDQDIYDVAVALFDLLQYPLFEVRRNNSFTLTNE